MRHTCVIFDFMTKETLTRAFGHCAECFVFLIEEADNLVNFRAELRSLKMGGNTTTRVGSR